jgi:putative ABC transport system permease protein
MVLFYFVIDQSKKNQFNRMQHVIYQQVTKEQIQKLSKDTRIEAMILTKMGKSMEIGSYVVIPFYYEQKNTPMKTSAIVEGNYPKKMYDIEVDKSYMKQIGRKLKLGDKLDFTFLDGTAEEFTISGFTDTGVSSKIYSLIVTGIC